MKRIGIVGAMGSEVELLKGMLEDFEEIKTSGRTFYFGKINGTEAVLVCSGIGKVNSAMSTQMLIDIFNVDAVINTGIAGGAGEARVRDCVISSETAYHDMELRFVAMNYPFTETFKASEELIEIAKKACDKVGIKSFVARIATGDQFIADKEVKEDIINRLNPYAVEMEGGAVSHVCAVNDVPFVIIRTISDNADDEAEMSFDIFEKLAADDAAKIVADMLSQM